MRRKPVYSKYTSFKNSKQNRYKRIIHAVTVSRYYFSFKITYFTQINL